MDMRKKGIHIDGEVLEQIPYLRVTEGLLSMIDFGSSPTRESASAGHPSIPVLDRDRQSTPIFSPLCVVTPDDIRDAPLCRVCSDPDVGRTQEYGDTPYFRPIPVHQQEDNKQNIEDICNFGTKVSNWIEEHHTNKATTPTGSYESKPYLKSIEQPDFGRTISPIAMQSVLESEIEKGKSNAFPSNQHQPEQQNFADSLQQQQVLDLTTPSHDNKHHLNVENQQVPPVANFQKPAQQVINRPQPVVNSHQQHKLPVTTDEMPSDHVLHFPPSVQHENVYRQQEQLVASHLQQASQAYPRLSPSENPLKQHRDIYKPDTPTVERVQPFSPLF
ncbi:unnamed protein product [Mytilus coruscus]|uniref:Uncharacterized protein n=1 Tax=Mytilus coruscus TaxID=42192 RepID=A0A6J8B9Z6_MYTCO|nr:unnamed protein product [Mytilus coruscus]